SDTVMARSRSRSPRRDRDRDSRRDRSRSRDRERRDRDRKRDRRRRDRSESASGGEEGGHSLGSLLKKKRERDRRSPSPKAVPREIVRELESATFDASRLSEAAAAWIETRITEQVTSRVGQLEAAMSERIAAARTEMETRLRAQIEHEMQEEMAECAAREKDSKTRCEQLEKELESKLQEAELSERKFNEERLSMLAQKSALERERAELARERDAVTKTEQQTILNKGGQSRAPIKFKFGK
ncbi:hypothetical protein PFISCL1PPCAC_26119, partial [Pristionchus fissidentatus]